MSKPAIEIQNVSKRYRLGQGGGLDRTLRDAVCDGLSRVLRPRRTARPTRDLWALRDVSFNVQRGEVMGIVGRNGAGKSTLLKILSRITDPTQGSITLRGRVASLLEVGTGFHPELSGRENIYLNGTILGMNRAEVKARFDDIVDFSGVEAFLDTPVKRYSSGMRVRLAFAVAAHLEPEILIVDEVLAVGDASFQQKCLGKLQSVARGEGRTVLFVSHNLQAVRSLCGRVAWIDAGRIADLGEPEEITQRYLDATRTVGGLTDLPSLIKALPSDPDFTLLSAEVSQADRSTQRVSNDQPFEVRMTYRVQRALPGLRVYFDLCDEYGDLLIRSFHDEHDAEPAVAQPGLHSVTATVPANLLAPRKYTLALQAGIYNVRDCTNGGVHMTLDVERASRINLAYPHDPIRAKFQPKIQWLRATEERLHACHAA